MMIRVLLIPKIFQIKKCNSVIIIMAPNSYSIEFLLLLMMKNEAFFFLILSNLLESSFVETK